MPSKYLTLFKYPGGKSKLIDVLHSKMSRQLEFGATYHEVFVGGGPLLLEVAKRHPNIKLCANDLDENVYAFWDLLASAPQKEFDQLLILLSINPTIDKFWREREKIKQEEAGIITRSRLMKAYHCVFFHKTTFNGMFHANPIGGKDQKSKWKIDCHYTAKNIIKKVAEARQRVYKRLTVFNLSVVDYINLIPVSGNLLYLDPPYYTVGDKLYPVSMSRGDHKMLSLALKRRSKGWVLSYDTCDEITSMYSFANLELTSTWYSSSSFNKSGKCKIKEEFIITPNDNSKNFKKKL